ncbi:hypothetical protein HON22_00585 [Candidatus Peregrinibacteria bacterium]|jgi:hypothetical protein|nr:hypothetical protein [Candidatus Peregrinibacteria bacterium]
MNKETSEFISSLQKLIHSQGVTSSQFAEVYYKNNIEVQDGYEEMSIDDIVQDARDVIHTLFQINSWLFSDESGSTE